MSNCVLPGVTEAFANLFCWVSILISEDLPTFDLPINANSGRSETGHSESLEALVTNVAETIAIEKLYYINIRYRDCKESLARIQWKSLKFSFSFKLDFSYEISIQYYLFYQCTYYETRTNYLCISYDR